ncbi:MAG: peptidase MA family metallohydrolase, partial [Chloroflexota bacterium]|nr:peptidase MA family metallohydrolase [Dehalococcoidia bacterium]MDW8047146.1 peptidase MA family metallohydrolase [Chloroflexota bacterium]
MAPALLRSSFLLGLALLLPLLLHLPARAQATLTVLDEGVEPRYPQALDFRIRVQADRPITGAVLRYQVLGSGTSAFVRVEDLQPAAELDLRAPVEVNTSSSYIPVGSRFRYHWEFTLEGGATAATPETTFVFLPPGREWRSVETDVLRVFFYGDREALARQYLEAGSETYERLARGLFGVDLPLLPVHVVLFATEDELSQARPGRGSTFDAAVVTCGTKVSSDVVLVIPLSCGTSDRADTLRHELAHIINAAAGESALGKLPSWLDEGLAVWAQSEPGGNYTGAFQANARAGRLIPFAQMVSPPNDPSRVNLFYGQAYAMVAYLIDEFGEAKLAQLLATVKGGERFDRAIEQVYGLSLDEFERRFLRRFSPDSLATPTPGPARGVPSPQATARPPLQTTADSDGGLDPVVVAAFGGGVLLLLLATLAALLGMWAQQRSAAAPQPRSPQGQQTDGP